MKYSVGVCQFQPKLFDMDYNLNKMENMLTGVTSDLMVLPELVTSGYVFNNIEEVKKVSEDVNNGPTAKLFKKLAAKNNTSYVVGFAEKEREKFYNTVILVNPDGKIYSYRKIHLFYEEKKWFEPGNIGFDVFEAKEGIRVGLMICFDWIFPEATRTLALKGAQIIAHPSNLVLPFCQQAMITRSIENCVFTITANRTGKEKNGDKELHFTGTSQIVTTKGEIVKRFNENEERVFVTEIEPALANDKKVTTYNDVFEDRRKEFYL